MGASRSNQGTDRRVQQQPNYFEHSVAHSQFPHWDRGSEEIKQYVNQCESHGERTHRPCQPRSRTSAHPTDSSPPFACSFRHNSTLQHRRLSSVTATVTKPSGERTSENAQKAKFAGGVTPRIAAPPSTRARERDPPGRGILTSSGIMRPLSGSEQGRA